MKFLKQKSIAGYRKKFKPVHCPIFEIPLEAEDAVLDHDHETGAIRSVIHRDANQFEGKVMNMYKRYVRSRVSDDLPTILRNLAHYLEYHKDNPSDLKHPGHILVQVREYMKLPVSDQKRLLAEFDLPDKNQTIRKKSFRKYVMTKFKHLTLEELESK
jgi:hypothetical protein